MPQQAAQAAAQKHPLPDRHGMIRISTMTAHLFQATLHLSAGFSDAP
jgi:hypothetical protein